MQHLTGRTFSGIFQEPVEIKATSIPGNITIISGPSEKPNVLTVDDQIIESGSFDSPKAQIWPKEGK